MHSTSKWPSHSEWSSELPCMRWRLRRLPVVFVPVQFPDLFAILLAVREQRGRSE